MNYLAARSFIEPLLTCRSPSTITGRVRSVVVNAVQASAGGGIPHIGVEVWKAEAPSIANDNAAGAVVSIATRLRVIAARNHVLPAHIYRIIRLAVFNFPTTATLTKAIYQVSAANFAFCAAIANTKPFGIRRAAWTYSRSNGPSSKALTCDILQGGHRRLLPEQLASSGDRRLPRRSLRTLAQGG